MTADYLTVAEIAAQLRLSRMTVYRLIRAGAIQGLRVGRSIRVPQASLDAYLGAAAEARLHAAPETERQIDDFLTDPDTGFLRSRDVPS